MNYFNLTYEDSPWSFCATPDGRVAEQSRVNYNAAHNREIPPDEQFLLAVSTADLGILDRILVDHPEVRFNLESTDRSPLGLAVYQPVVVQHLLSNGFSTSATYDGKSFVDQVAMLRSSALLRERCAGYETALILHNHLSKAQRLGIATGYPHLDGQPHYDILVYGGPAYHKCLEGEIERSFLAFQLHLLTGVNGQDVFVPELFDQIIKSMPTRGKAILEAMASDTEFVLNKLGIEPIVSCWAHAMLGSPHGRIFRATLMNELGIGQEELDTLWFALQDKQDVITHLGSAAIQALRLRLAFTNQAYVSEQHVSPECTIKPYLSGAMFDGLAMNYVPHSNGTDRIIVHVGAPFAFLMYHNEDPVAIASFVPVNSRTLLVQQIQALHVEGDFSWGSKPVSPKFLESHPDWRSTLVKAIKPVAQQLHFEWVGIQSGENNLYANSPLFSEEIPMERAKRIYNGTAQKLGMKQTWDNNFFIRVQDL